MSAKQYDNMETANLRNVVGWKPHLNMSDLFVLEHSVQTFLPQQINTEKNTKHSTNIIGNHQESLCCSR